MEENKNSVEKVTVTVTIEKETQEKKPFNKKNLIICAAIGVALAVIITVIILLAGSGNNQPEVTTPLDIPPQETTTEDKTTTPQATTPQTTTPAGPTETVTFPSDEPDDPKQEDVFFN